jgi:hypothetical protein
MREGLFAGTKTPRAPVDLRERALRAARAAAREPAPSQNHRFRLATFDLAWLTALLVLVLCHVLLSLSHGPSPVISGTSQAIAEARQLEKELGLKGVPMVFAGWDTARNGDAQRRLMEELERL